MAKKKAKKKARASKGKARSRKAPSMEMLLVGSKTKAALKGHGVNVASDALEALNMVVYWYIDQAAKRTSSNGRKTVRAHDFLAM